MGLKHPFLVFQLFVPPGQHVSFEIGFSDAEATRRRLFFSSSFAEPRPSSLHCQVPLPETLVVPGRWNNLVLHLPSLARFLFEPQSVEFRAVESVAVGATCKLRKIFTLRAPPPRAPTTLPLQAIARTHERGADLDGGGHARRFDDSSGGHSHASGGRSHSSEDERDARESEREGGARRNLPRMVRATLRETTTGEASRARVVARANGRAATGTRAPSFAGGPFAGAPAPPSLEVSPHSLELGRPPEPIHRGCDFLPGVDRATTLVDADTLAAHCDGTRSAGGLFGGSFGSGAAQFGRWEEASPDRRAATSVGRARDFNFVGASEPGVDAGSPGFGGGPSAARGARSMMSRPFTTNDADGRRRRGIVAGGGAPGTPGRRRAAGGDRDWHLAFGSRSPAPSRAGSGRKPTHSRAADDLNRGGRGGGGAPGPSSPHGFGFGPPGGVFGAAVSGSPISKPPLFDESLASLGDLALERSRANTNTPRDEKKEKAAGASSAPLSLSLRRAGSYDAERYLSGEGGAGASFSPPGGSPTARRGRRSFAESDEDSGGRGSRSSLSRSLPAPSRGSGSGAFRGSEDVANPWLPGSSGITGARRDRYDDEDRYDGDDANDAYGPAPDEPEDAYDSHDSAELAAGAMSRGGSRRGGAEALDAFSASELLRRSASSPTPARSARPRGGAAGEDFFDRSRGGGIGGGGIGGVSGNKSDFEAFSDGEEADGGILGVAAALNDPRSPYEGGRAKTVTADGAHTWSDSNGIAYFDGTGVSGGPGGAKEEEEGFGGSGPGASSFRVFPEGAFLPREGGSAERGETPIPGRAPPPAGHGQNYRLFTPDLVMVSDEPTKPRPSGDSSAPRGPGEGGANGAGKTNGTTTTEAEAPTKVGALPTEDGDAGEGGGEGAAGDETGGAGDETGAAAELDLIYDPILNFYYDPKDGKYYELVP